MLAKAHWGALIPHQGNMSLLDEVIAFDPDHIHARSASHRSPDNPLRSAGILHAVHLCEYGAQAMAVHGALCAQAEGGRARPGLLAALRAVELHCSRVDTLGGALDIHARRLLASASGWQYEFEVLHGTRLLARGRAMVMLQDAA